MDLEEMRSLDDFEQRALLMLNPLAKSYFTATAGCQQTLNQTAFNKYKIKSRVFRDVKEVDTSTSLLGNKMPFPVGIAPTGLHNLANIEAEEATAKAARKSNCLLTVSCVSSLLLGDIAKVAHPTLKWMQIYIFNDKDVTMNLVKQAEVNGFTAIVVTADSPAGGLWRENVPKQFFSIYGSRNINLPDITQKLLNPSASFKDLLWLKEITHLPIVVKGIMRGEDALEAARHGASAIWISNHGARQVDGVLATIDSLPEVVEALTEYDIEIYLDGGVRRGCDVFRALALGANAVFIGRPVIYGLTVAGEAGVSCLLDRLQNEFMLTMKLAGVNCLKDINKSMVEKEICLCKL